MEQTLNNINDMEDEKDDEIELSQMRYCLVGFIRDLSNLAYQEREWLGMNHPRAFWGSLTMIINFLYNDYDLDENIERKIGIIIRNEEEAKMLSIVMKSLDNLLDTIGERKDNEFYWNTPLWLEVVEKARAAYDYIKLQGKDSEYIDQIEETEARKQAEYNAKIKRK